MKTTLYTLFLSSLGIIMFAALRVLFDTTISSWGIALSAIILLFAIVRWVMLISRNNEGTKTENLDN
jgi:hypothetical protein